MGGRYDIMQRIKEVLEASDPRKYGDAAPATPVAPPPPPATTPPPPAAPAGQEELLALLREGRKLQAVKRYRELTGVGLAEAKAAVEALERGADAAGAPPPAPPDMDALAARVAALARHGDTIGAIRLYREATGVELREAKEAVEAIAAHPGAPGAAPPPPPPASVPPPPGGAVPDWLAPVVAELRRGDTIGAIRAYRAVTGVGLAEAKATVEALERQLAGRGYPR